LQIGQYFIHYFWCLDILLVNSWIYRHFYFHFLNFWQQYLYHWFIPPHAYYLQANLWVFSKNHQFCSSFVAFLIQNPIIIPFIIGLIWLAKYCLEQINQSPFFWHYQSHYQVLVLSIKVLKNEHCRLFIYGHHQIHLQIFLEMEEFNCNFKFFLILPNFQSNFLIHYYSGLT